MELTEEARQSGKPLSVFGGVAELVTSFYPLHCSRRRHPCDLGTSWQPASISIRLQTAMKTDIDRIWTDLGWIASEPRPAESARLEECRRYCEQQLTEAGWQVRRVPFSAEDSVLTRRNGINLVCESVDHQTDRPALVVGAHLDSRENTPGADDNASAVAVLLEIARQWKSWPALQLSAPSANLQLVVFDLEEHGMLGGIQPQVPPNCRIQPQVPPNCRDGLEKVAGRQCGVRVMRTLFG